MMVSRIVLACVAVAALETSACAQASDAPATVGYVEQALKENNTELMAQFRMMLSEALDQKDRQSSDTSGDDGLVPINPTLEERVDKLEKEIGNHGATLGQIAMQGESGGYHVRFDTNSQSAREEVKRAMDSTVPETGELIVRNQTNHDEWIIINGEQQLILAGATRSFDVKPGTVTSRLRHEQQPLAMYVGFPKYRQTVDILERPLPQTDWIATAW